MSVTVTSPSSSTYLFPGDTHTITWSTSGISAGTNMTIQLRKDGTSYGSNISNQTPNDGSYSWTLDSNLPRDQNWQIRIFTYGDYSNIDDSDEFKIGVLKEPADVSQFSADSVTEQAVGKWRILPADASQFSADSISTSTTKWELLPVDVSQFSADSVSTSVDFWFKVLTISDASQFSADSVSTSTMKWNLVATDASQFSADSVTTSVDFWFKVLTISDASQFSADSVSTTKGKWKIISTDATQFSADSVTTTKGSWRFVLYMDDATSFTEATSTIHGGPSRFWEIDADNSEEQFATSRTTGWIPTGPIDKNPVLRRINMAYKSTDPVKVKVYTNEDDDNAIFDKTFAASASAITEKSLRIGKRAKNFKVQLDTDLSGNYNTLIDKMEIEVDGRATV